MVQGVLHQGLEGQFREAHRLQAGVHLNSIVQNVLVTGLLNLEVAAHMLLLFPQGNDVLPPAQGVAEEVGQVGHHLHRRLGPVRLNQPDDGIHGVVQEMGVDLGLQQRQLRFAQAGLLLGDLLNLGVDPGDHLLHPLAEGTDFIGLRADRLPDRQVAADDVLRPAAQVHHRLGDGPAQPDAVADQQQDQNGKERQQQQNLRPDLPGNLLLQKVQLHRLAVEVVIHVLLNQCGEDIDVVFQLHLAAVVTAGLLNLVNFLLQVLAQVQHAGDGPEAVLLAGGIEEVLRQVLGGLDLLDGQALGIPAFNHIVIHLEVDIFLEILVELRGGGYIVQEVFILAVVGQHQRQHHRQDHRRKGAENGHQTVHPALDGIRTAHNRFPPPR